MQSYSQKLLSPWYDELMQLLFPQRNCLLCNAAITGAGICDDCERKRRLLLSCPRCATFVDEKEADKPCDNCLGHRRYFTSARAAVPYKQLHKQLWNFKNNQQTYYKRSFAALLSATYRQHFQGIAFDAIVPLPIAPQRMQERGYNQSQLVTAVLARDLAISHQPQLLRRVKETPPLFNIGRQQRRELLKGAFVATATAKGKTLLLVDDIFTTGATSNEASKALLCAGADAVYVLTICSGEQL